MLSGRTVPFPFVPGWLTVNTPWGLLIGHRIPRKRALCGRCLRTPVLYEIGSG